MSDHRFSAILWLIFALGVMVMIGSCQWSMVEINRIRSNEKVGVMTP